MTQPNPTGTPGGEVLLSVPSTPTPRGKRPARPHIRESSTVFIHSFNSSVCGGHAPPGSQRSVVIFQRGCKYELFTAREWVLRQVTGIREGPPGRAPQLLLHSSNIMFLCSSLTEREERVSHLYVWDCFQGKMSSDPF